MAEYKRGFKSKHERVQRRDHTGRFGAGQTLRPSSASPGDPMPNPSRKDERAAEYERPRRKVGDVDPVGKAAFQAELARARQPVKPQEKASKPKKIQEGPVPETTFRKATGALRTRKERIDYEVEQAQK